MSRETIEHSIYPEVNVKTVTREDLTIIEIATKLRVKHDDGLYYYFKHYYTNKVLNKNCIFTLTEMLERLHKEVYASSIAGKINLDLVYGNGDPVFTKCESQEDEEVRLKREILN